MFAEKRALLLDMNGTFMFGEDRFGTHEDFPLQYKSIGGTLPDIEVNKIVRSVYSYLEERYLDQRFMDSFPSVLSAIVKIKKRDLSEEEIQKIIDTFAFHELGYIPDIFVDTLVKLSERFILSVVIDIWSPKKYWIETFENLGINKLFSASSFSSDHGMVKPSPRPFELVVGQLKLEKKDCLVVGDSPRRDLSGAKTAGIDCVLVGGANDTRALGTFPSLLAFCDEVM